MPFAEPLAQFLADFGQACTLAGAAVTAIVDIASYEDIVTGVVTQGPSALVQTSAVPAAAAGQAFLAGGVNYAVRQVLKEPPDGAFTRLVLARTP